MDDKTLEEAAKVFTQVAATGTLYQDAIQPVAKQIGRSLETIGGVINVALGPVALMVHGYDLIQENLRRRLEEKLKDVPKERIVEPPLSIVGPLLEKYRFVHNQPYLADLYENLLANSMDEQTVRQSHPAFVQIIGQLTPDEAKLLQEIAKDRFRIPKFDLYISFTDDGAGGPPPQGELLAISNLTNLDRRTGIASGLTRIYITNLERLGILETRPSPYFLDGSYDDLLDHPDLLKHTGMAPAAGLKVRISKGGISATDFGDMFIKAVSRKSQ